MMRNVLLLTKKSGRLQNLRRPSGEMPKVEKPHERIREASPDEHQDLTINGIRVVNEAVSAAASKQYYRIQVAMQSDVRLDVTGMRADADLQLLNSSGWTL